MTKTSTVKMGSFWEHLDDLRGTLFRIALSIILLGMVAFFFKEALFSIILAPKDPDFITYKLLDQANNLLPTWGSELESFSVKLINIELAQQFIIHIKMALYAAFLLVFPYILFELFRFIAPALHQRERRYVVGIAGSAYALFMVGVALSYFVIFPLTFRFLGTYQVSPDVQNQIVLNSYISTLMMLNLMMGLVFEIPILCWMLAKLGFISSSLLRQYRRHAIIVLLLIAAIITPSSDIVTLLLVSLPMYVLYEISIVIVSWTRKKSLKPLFKP